MTTRTICSIGVICLLVQLASGEGVIEKFAKQSLAVDQQKYPFGMKLDQRFSQVDAESGFVTSTRETFLGPPIRIDSESETNDYENEFVWCVDESCTNYSRAFPARNLFFGFKKGRLAAIRIGFSTLFNIKDLTSAEEAKRDLQKIQGALGRLRASNPQLRWNSPLGDGQLRMLHATACGPNPESLFVSTIQIMPVERSE